MTAVPNPASEIAMPADEYPNDREVVISVHQVSKKFCRNLKRSLMYGVRDIASDLLGGQRQSQVLRPEEFWALQDVSFQLRQGQALGLVGANGAGKSTLLRLISGLIKPDTGSLTVHGQVAPLIALGAGFNPILTGRENIYANMSVLGLPTAKIKERFQSVVDFAGIDHAIDAPVQTYSSGMAARLGFACAIHIEPDILLVDEVLAVGDASFRIKCYRQLAKLREQGTAFILVSHNSQTILNVCDSAIYLQSGQLITSGSTSDVMQKYEANLYLQGSEQALGAIQLPPKPQSESSGLDITAVFFRDLQGNLMQKPTSGEPAILCVACKTNQQIEQVNLTIAISALSGESDRVLYLSSAGDGQMLVVSPDQSELQLHLLYCGLAPGLYSAKIIVREGLYFFDKFDAFRFAVAANSSMGNCAFYQPRSWNIAHNSTG
jgi:lipopolysaccharide transport system ATP-binding protein